MPDAIRAALLQAASPEGLSGWDHGTKLVAYLKRTELVRAVKVDRATRYQITDAGRRVLEGAPQ